MLFENGQALSADFTMAAFIFIILLVAINSLWVSNITEINDRAIVHRMNSRINLVLNQLVNTTGYPIRWESNINTAESIGLAKVSKPRVLSQDKLNAFFSADYNTIVEKLGMEGYHCNFYLLKTDETELASISAGDFNATYLTVDDRLIMVGRDTRIIRIEAGV